MTKNLKKFSYYTFIVLIFAYVLSPDSFDQSEQSQIAHLSSSNN